MKQTIIRVEEVDFDLDLEEEFESDNYKLVINGFRTYRGINKNIDRRSLIDEGYRIITIYANIHGAICFTTDKQQLMPFDGGTAGFLAVKDKDFSSDEINYIIEKLDSLYNGWYKSVNVIERTFCDCCETIKDEEYLDSWLCFTQEEVEKAKELLRSEYNVKITLDFS